jgi:hypothetical protein
MGTLLVAYGQSEKLPSNAPPLTISIAGRIVSTLAFDGTACGRTAKCASGLCRDGFCCDGDCTDPCLTCGSSAKPGTCLAVQNAEDDTCSGSTMCDGNGACRTKTGSTCTASSGLRFHLLRGRRLL